MRTTSGNTNKRQLLVSMIISLLFVLMGLNICWYYQPNARWRTVLAILSGCGFLLLAGIALHKFISLRRDCDK